MGGLTPTPRVFRKGPKKENTMANALTLILPLAFTLAVATWGPLSTRNRPQPCADSIRNGAPINSPCED
jgi:hypothetical protein